MFRRIAYDHDRKHIEKSLQRQARIADANIAFDNSEPSDFSSISEGEDFFAPILPAEPLSVEGNRVVFQSDITTESTLNNTFECLISNSGSKDHVIVVFHHWYAKNRYQTFSRYFARKGVTVVEATLPYHFTRGSDACSEENFLNANIGRTVQSVRQAVLDGRKIVRWLGNQGYGRITVVGMCIGGTVAGLVAAHERKVQNAVLMVSPASPADLVWTAETMRSLRGRIEPSMSLEDLRKAWSMIDLNKHLWSLTRSGLETMFILGEDDTIARPEGMDGVIEHLLTCGRDPNVVRLNCGHSSVGVFPYNIKAARKVLRFTKSSLSLRESVKLAWDARVLIYPGVDLSEGVPFPGATCAKSGHQKTTDR